VVATLGVISIVGDCGIDGKSARIEVGALADLFAGAKRSHESGMGWGHNQDQNMSLVCGRSPKLSSGMVKTFRGLLALSMRRS
jgi:hypothetical protein